MRTFEEKASNTLKGKAIKNTKISIQFCTNGLKNVKLPNLY